MNVYIIEVTPGDGWGESYFYVFRKLENAIAKMKEIAKAYNMTLDYDNYFAYRYGDYDIENHIMEVILHEEAFED